MLNINWCKLFWHDFQPVIARNVTKKICARKGCNCVRSLEIDRTNGIRYVWKTSKVNPLIINVTRPIPV